MKVGILHISDIHFCERKFDNNSDTEMVKRICAAVKTELIGCSDVIIIISGDIAFGGLREEYNYAEDWAVELYTQIDDSCEANCRIICAPGNHDVDHSISNPVRDCVINGIKNNSTHINSDIIEECTGEQTAFFDFRQKIESNDTVVFDNQLLRIHRLQNDAIDLQILVFNSAWMSSLHENPGTIVYPIELFRDQLQPVEGYTVSVMHHPFGWFKPENARILRNKISEISSICLCGHEHIPDSTQVSNLLGSEVKLIDGGVLKPHEDNTKSSFNLVLLNTKDCKIKNFIYKLEGIRYEHFHDSDWQDATKLKGIESKQFRLSSDKRNEIEELGINIVHPHRDQLYLRDIFVYPDLLLISSKDSKDFKRIEQTTSTELLIFEQDATHVILEGEEKIGKTALLRMLFSEFYNRGKIPLLIDGSSINFRTDAQIKLFLRRAFEDSYEGEDFTDYNQLDRTKRIVLLNNIDFSKHPQSEWNSLLTYIRQFASKSVFTTNDIASLKNMMISEPNILLFQEHDLYSIQEFGHVKRDQLIKKWLLVGQQHEDWESESILIERDKARDIINKTIGHNLMPSFPIFILTILQSIDSRTLSTIGSTYGHYYHFLITSSLLRSGVKPEDLDAYSNYISELAYEFFQNNKRKSILEYVTWHEKYCKKYGILWVYSQTSEILQSSGILTSESTDTFRFKYPYVYYFFLAKRLSRGISESLIRERITKMCQRLHVEEYANVILFLIHHSDDSLVVNSIRTAANSLVSQQDIFQFEKDQSNSQFKAIDNLTFNKHASNQNLEQRDPEEEQNRILQKKDEIERVTHKNGAKFSSSEDMQLDSKPMEALDTIAQSIVAIKTIDILGLVLKNYYGSLEIETKVDIGNDAIKLAFRSLFSIFELFTKDVDEIISAFVEIQRDYELKHLNPAARKNDQELTHSVRFFLFSLIKHITKFYIQKVARAIGSQQLKPTVDSLVLENGTIGYLMIEVAILLDKPSNLPRDKIKILTKKLRHDTFGFEVLRDLVRTRIYRYPMEYTDKQWVISKLNFSIVEQRFADFKQTRRMLK